VSFKFQPILNLRKHHEDHCRTCLKEEQTKLRQIDGELSMLKASKEKREKEKEQMSLGVIRPENLLFASGYLAYLRQKQAETKVRRTFQAGEVEAARVTLVQAQKEKKVMEKLKEKMAREEKEELLRHEQKNLDEIAINRIYHS
jgi:flagellar FliJ protein